MDTNLSKSKVHPMSTLVIAEPIEKALRDSDPQEALSRLVETLHQQSYSKQAISDAVFAEYRRFRETGRDDDAEAIAEILDCLTGFCGPTSRLITNEPDVKLKTAD
jgi:hypothetical protein